MRNKVTVELTETQLYALIEAAKAGMANSDGHSTQSYVDLLGRALYSIDQALFRKGGRAA